MWIRLAYPKQDPRNLLLGIVLAFAMLDHTRMFFYYWNVNPTAIGETSIMLFLTRFLSHFFAPSIFLLLGIEMYQYGQRYGPKRLTKTLCYTAVMLLALELVVNNFLYTFDPYYRTIGLFILGLLGLCFLCMAGLQYLGRKSLFVISLLLLSGHHLLDGIQLEGSSLGSICWYLLHQQKFIPFPDRLFIVNYTLIPWLGVLMLGYAMGKLFLPHADPAKRKHFLLRAGYSSLALFFMLRFTNVYGDPIGWNTYADPVKSVLSFLNLTKYPASLAYLSLTLGTIFLFLGYTANCRGNKIFPFYVLGRRPLFIYLFSTFLIHLMAMALLWLTGKDPAAMLITSRSYTSVGPLTQYGYSIGVVYIIWIGILLLCYAVNAFLDYLMNRKSNF